MLSQAENYIFIVFLFFSFIAMNANTRCISHEILSNWQLGRVELFRFIFLDSLTEFNVNTFVLRKMESTF